MSPPSSGSKNKPSKKPAESRWDVWREATRSSKTSVYFQRTTRRYIPEDRTLHSHRCEKFKSYIESYCSSTNPYSTSHEDLNDFSLVQWSIQDNFNFCHKWLLELLTDLMIFPALSQKNLIHSWTWHDSVKAVPASCILPPPDLYVGYLQSGH
jgi:hypothetical protein